MDESTSIGINCVRLFSKRSVCEFFNLCCIDVGHLFLTCASLFFQNNVPWYVGIMVDKYLFVQNVHHVGIIANIRIESSYANHQLLVYNVGSCIKILEQS